MEVTAGIKLGQKDNRPSILFVVWNPIASAYLVYVSDWLKEDQLDSDTTPRDLTGRFVNAWPYRIINYAVD
ncbi:hypothetical protein GCM10009000_116140 [Halobacterium noricense]